MEKIILEGEQGEKIELYPLEATRLGGVDYLLVVDAESGDANCFILRECSDDGGDEVWYELEEDEKILDSLLSIFAELLDDVDFVD